MANLSDFLPAAGGGGGGIPKYEEFTSSGTFTPTQALIDAGGRISYIVVGGGQKGQYSGGSGGAVLWGITTITSATPFSILIGAGASGGAGSGGGATTVSFSTAGGTNVVAAGGTGEQNSPFGKQNSTFGFGSGGSNSTSSPGISGNFNPTNWGNYGGGNSAYTNATSGIVRLYWFE